MRTKLSVCLRKAEYPTENDARQAVLRSELDLRSYRCDRCKRFHLTSRTKGKRTPRSSQMLR